MPEDFKVALIIGLQYVYSTFALLHDSSLLLPSWNCDFIVQLLNAAHSRFDVSLPHLTKRVTNLRKLRLFHVETKITSRFNALVSTLSIALDGGIRTS